MKNVVILMLFINSLTSFGQIVVGGDKEPPKKDKPAKKEKPQKVSADSISVAERTEIFVGANWSSTYRKLTENDNIFGDSIGTRADETSIGKWSYSLGMRTKISKFLMFEGGISFLQNGEQYRLETQDSTYSYVNHYRFIGMPLHLYGVFGERKLRFQVGIGAIPQMALKFEQNTTVVDNEERETKSDLKTKVGMSSFVFSVSANLGVQYEFLPTWSIFVLPEYRVQLTSSFLKTSKFIHQGNAFGIGFGIVKAI